MGEELVNEMDRLVKDNASIGERKKEMKQQFAKIISVLVS